MAEEELVFQLLEEERKARTKRIAEEKKITTEDCLVIGVLRLNKEIDGLYKRIDEMDKRINSRIDSNFRWTIGMLIGMWATMLAILISILLKVA